MAVQDERIAHERALIGCAILDGAEVRQCCGWLPESSFWSEELGLFWRRFVAGEDGLSIAADIGTQFYYEATGWMNDCLSPAREAPAHARRIAHLAHLGDVQSSVAELGRAVAAGAFEDTQRILADLAQRTPSQSRRVPNALDVGEAFVLAMESPDRMVLTGLPALDTALSGGLERQSLSVLAARPSMGKSTLAFQIARNVAASGRRVLFVSLEMSRVNLWARAACPLVGLTWGEVRSRRYTTDQHRRLLDANAELMMSYNEKLLIHDEPCDSAAVWEMASGEHVDVVIVDHLRLLNDRDGDNENKRLGQITWRFKQMAKRLDLHAMLLAQLNRQFNDRADKRPDLTDLRDSGEIEENADVVLMPHGEWYYKPERERGDRTNHEVWVRKARDGKRNVLINLVFDRRAQWFCEPGNEPDGGRR